MKNLLIGAALSAIVATGAIAKDVTITATDLDQKNWAAAGPIFEQCVAAAVLRGDAGLCRQLSAFIAENAAKVQAAVDAANKPLPVPPAKK